VPQLYNLKIPDWYVEHEEVDLDQFDAMMAYGNGGGSGGSGGGGGGGSRRRNKKKNAPRLDETERSTQWTALMVLEAYSEKKSYYNGKGGTPDTTKSGSELLKDIVDGKLRVGCIVGALVGQRSCCFCFFFGSILFFSTFLSLQVFFWCLLNHHPWHQWHKRKRKYLLVHRVVVVYTRPMHLLH
jgi:hypothetical protein